MKRRVVIYARVSTEHEAQISALENQVQYYDEILKRHPEWELVDRYIDEGITGTSIHKRESFLRMIEDAKNRRFDLIITREVSRFARNIVDTLQQTRLLRTYGVEVWFTEDNIWTLNDEDGELRLSIMATLAQNESKKISQRVKAGQMISFKNGVLYGNGNILGYTRIGDKMVVDEEQAKAVRRIFELYLQGNGIRKIQDIMEQEGYRTASGLTNWQAGNINRVLKNSFYCGRIEYRKQYVPDYLTQKKINNHGEVEKIYVQGTHEILISPEDFDTVQRMRSTRSVKGVDGKNHGKTQAKSIWVKKTKCTCNHAMNRRVTYVAKNGDKSYVYQCYNQLQTGTKAARIKKGLSVDNICENTTFTEWKLEVQADFIFKKLVKNKQAIYDTAMEMIGELNSITNTKAVEKDKIEANIKEIDKLKGKMAVLVDLCTEGDISREVFREKKQKIEDEILRLEKLNIDNRQKILDVEKDGIVEDRMKGLSEFIKMKAFDAKRKIPSTIIDQYVDQIIFDKGVFTWILNPALGNKYQRLSMDTSGMKKHQGRLKLMCCDEATTGSYQSKVGECYLFSVKLDFEKAKEYRKSYGAYLRHNQWNDIEVEVCMLI